MDWDADPLAHLRIRLDRTSAGRPMETTWEPRGSTLQMGVLGLHVRRPIVVAHLTHRENRFPTTKCLSTGHPRLEQDRQGSMTASDAVDISGLCYDLVVS
jgi:hypothetical protein